MSIKKSILISFAEKYSTLAISFVGVMIIARLLTPREIGIYSVASAVTAIAQMLRDFGVGTYLIQERELTKDKIRAALSITCATSWVAGGALFVIRPWAVEFYHEQALSELIAIQCLSFLILPFSAPILALLRREMKFGVLFRINLMSSITQFVVSISLAMSGYGYLSMAWASVASLCCTVLLVTANRPRDAWVLPGYKGWKPIARFGIQTSVSAIVTEIAMNMNDLAVGRILGFQAVALYSRAQGLMYLFHRDMMDAVKKVVFPVFAAAVREDKDLLAAYLKAVSLITVFAWPFYGFLGLYAHQVMNLLFGDQWDAAVPLVKILVFGGAVAALFNLSHQTLIAMGMVNKSMRIQLWVQLVRIPLVIIAATYSIEMVCYSYIVFFVFSLFVNQIYLKDVLGLKFWRLMLGNMKSLLVAIFSIILPIVNLTYVPYDSDNEMQVFIGAVGLASGWLIGVFIFRHPIAKELKVFGAK